MIEAFLSQQAHYRRFWKAIGWVSLGLAVTVLVYLTWQVLVGLVTSYVIVRAVIAGLRNS